MEKQKVSIGTDGQRMIHLRNQVKASKERFYEEKFTLKN